MAVVTCPFCRSATAVAPCQNCGAALPPLTDPRRLDRLWIPVVLVGVLVGTIAAVDRGPLTAKAGPLPIGFYVMAISTGVTALWFVARAFARRR
jgi:hypothetical protein